MSKNPKKQHTVPNSYLLRFADSRGFVWVYDRVPREIRSQPTKDTTIEQDFYTFSNKKGEKDYTLESKVFGEILEPQINRIIRKLESEDVLTRNDYGYLGAFATFQWLRTTASRRDSDYMTAETAKLHMRITFRDPESSQRAIDEYERATGSKLGITPEQATQFVKGNFGVKVPKEYHIRFMATVFSDFYKELFDLNWLILRAKKNDYFLTSDNPFFVARKRGNPLVPQHLSLGEITLPLTPKICLYMHGRGRGFGTMEISKKEVEQINCRTIYSSDRFVISRKLSDLKGLVKKTKLDSIPRKPSVILESPF